MNNLSSDGSPWQIGHMGGVLRFCLLAALVSAGCGSGDEETDRLVGLWAGELNQPAAGCLMGATFGADGLYEFDLICPLTGSSNAYAMEVETGSYAVENGAVRATPEASSCRSMRDGDVDTYRYSFAANGVLRLVTDRSVVALEPVDAEEIMPGSATFRFGCVTASGFVPEEVGRF